MSVMTRSGFDCRYAPTVTQYQPLPGLNAMSQKSFRYRVSDYHTARSKDEAPPGLGALQICFSSPVPALPCPALPRFASPFPSLPSAQSGPVHEAPLSSAQLRSESEALSVSFLLCEQIILEDASTVARKGKGCFLRFVFGWGGAGRGERGGR